MAETKRARRRPELLAAACVLAAIAPFSLVYLTSFFTVTMQRLHEYGLHGLAMSDPVCFSPFCDYPDFWAAGILARGHLLATLYHPDLFLAWRRSFFGQADIPPLNWMYPPPALLPSALISFAPLVQGYFIWLAALAGLSAWVLRGAGVAWRYILMTLLSPAAVWNLLLGQVGILCGALLVAGLLTLPARPIKAGILLACLLIKPQFGLLAPVLLLASRKWRAFISAACAVLVILVLATACFGWNVWGLFFGPAREASRIVLETPYPGEQIHAVSVFWAARSFGASVNLAFLAQFLSALAAAYAAWRAWRLDVANATARVALTTCLVPLVTPYGYGDDLVGLSLVFAMLASRDRPGLSIGAAIMWVCPALLPMIYVVWHILLAPLFFVFGAVIAWRRLVEKAGPPS